MVYISSNTNFLILCMRYLTIISNECQWFQVFTKFFCKFSSFPSTWCRENKILRITSVEIFIKSKNSDCNSQVSHHLASFIIIVCRDFPTNTCYSARLKLRNLPRVSRLQIERCCRSQRHIIINRLNLLQLCFGNVYLQHNWCQLLGNTHGNSVTLPLVMINSEQTEYAFESLNSRWVGTPLPPLSQDEDCWSAAS